ncbi:MAG: DNA polymerase domain-containing protein, partial [Candidatus Aenigmatarchaeota archaeon]
YSQLVEAMLMARTRDANEIIPNRPRYEEIERRRTQAKYEGGYVRQPKQGLIENVAVFDFRSLYPSIIVAHNIDISTLNCAHSGCSNNKAPEKNFCFCRQSVGFIPKALEELLRKRQEIKSTIKNVSPKERTSLNHRQFALKTVTNAAYGYYAYPGSRWYSRECAESVAAFGRNYIHTVINSADSFGFEVVYGDTDSLFVTTKSNMNERAQKFLDNVNKRLPGIMKLELGGIYATGLFVSSKTGAAAKKRYALMSQHGDLVIRGFERVRRDWCGLAKETQEKVLRLALEKKPEKAAEFVRSVVRDLRACKIPLQKLVIYTQLSKPLSEYELIGPHVAVAKRMFEQGRSVSEGTTIQYIIIKGEGSIADRARSADEVKPQDYDAEYYANNQVIPAALRVLKDLGYAQDDLSEVEQSKLGKFLK